MSLECVLVTGGCGFIGSHTAKRLLRDGFRVVVVDEMNNYYDPLIKSNNLRELRELAQEVSGVEANAYQRFSFHQVDIGDFSSLEKVFEKERPSLVVHLAARAGVRASIADPLVYAHSNVVGTTNIFELSNRFKVRSIAMASSSSVYGDRPAASQKSWKEERCVEAEAEADQVSQSSTNDASGDDEGEDEEDELPGAFKETDPVNKPASPYAATKRATELLAYTYNKLYDLPIACLRFFTVYGPGGRPDMAPFKFIHRIYNGITIDRYGDGSAIRDFTYVTDIVEGIVLSLLKPQGYQIYNLGGGRPVSLSTFISLCERAVGKKAMIRQLPTQPGDVARTHASIIKAKKMLGFRAKVHVADGLVLTAKWYAEFAAQKAQAEAATKAAAAAAAAADTVTARHSSGVATSTLASVSDENESKVESLLSSNSSSTSSENESDDAAAAVLTPSASSTALAYLAAAADFPSSPSTSSGVGSSKGARGSGSRSGSDTSEAAGVREVKTSDADLDSKLGSLFVCTRIYGGRRLTPGRREKLRSFVREVASLAGNGSEDKSEDSNAITACVAVEFDVATGGALYSDVKAEAEAALEGIAGRPKVTLAVLPVTQWGITTALNACVHAAAEAGAERIAFRSLEIAAGVEVMGRLARECSLRDTLVAGAALPGHAWGARSRVECDGLTCPWNTLAVWNTKLLSGIGFLAVGNGKNAVLDGAEAGMEEVSTVSVIQAMRVAARQPAKVKLVRVAGVDWDTAFRGDTARLAKHEAKMTSKVRRAEQHLAALDVAPATIIHC